MTANRPGASAAERALALVLGAGFLLMLAANLPGHLSVDSVMQLYEGRLQVRETFGPAVYSQILGFFDRLLPGAPLYVVASGLLLVLPLALLPRLRPRASWLGVAAGLLVVATPQFLVYQGIVWKDVLFANLTIAGFVALAFAARVWPKRGARWASLLLALVLLALASLIRQNGLVAALAAAAVVGWTARDGGWRATLGYGAGFLIALLVLANAIGAAAQPKGAGRDAAMGVGLRILQHYDIVAAAALDPTLPLSEIDRARPASDDFIRAHAREAYSPERVDYFDRVPQFGKNLWPVPAGAIRAEWTGLMLQHPDLYLRHRLAAFRWVFLTPEIGRCLPVYVGVTGPPEKLAALQLTAGIDPVDMRASGYAERFFATPLYSHLTYALIAAAVAGLLLLRRDPADMAMVGLMLAALGFAASFFVISIACDYRYLYFLDMAALTGLLYLALDPSLKGVRASS